MNLDLITQQILDAIRDLNDQLPLDGRIEPSPDAALLAPEGKLDSLGVVNLILLVEERMANRLSTELSLTDDRTLSQSQAVFRDVTSLATHIQLLIESRGNLGGAAE